MQNQDNILTNFVPFVAPDRKSRATKVYTDTYNQERKAHKKLCREIEAKLTVLPREMYDKYIKFLEDRITRLEELKDKVLNNRNAAQMKMMPFKDDINSKTNANMDKVFKCKYCNSHQYLIANEGYSIPQIFSFYWRAYTINNKRFFDIGEEIKLCRKRIIPFKQWFKIIKHFNAGVIQLMLIEAYELHLGHGLNSIRIRRVIRENPEINNPASFTKYKEIVKRGGTPHHPINAPDGEEWRIFYEERYKFEWYWSKKGVAFPNAYYYTYQPPNGKDSMIQLLFNYTAHNSARAAKYNF